MARIWCALAIAMVLSAAMPPVTSYAQKLVDLAWRCDNDPTPDSRIRDCTALIQSGKFHGKHLAAVFINRGKAFGESDQYDRALADFNEAIRLDPGNADAFNNRGIIYSYTSLCKRAVADFDHAIKLKPDHTDAINNRRRVFGTCR